MPTTTEYMKDIPVPCISIKQLPSGKQQVVLEKAPATPTSTPPGGGPVTVNPPDVSITLVADPSENYSVGKSYKITIQ